MSRNADVLLVTWDGAGNLPPERSLVRALIARGHTVRALAHPSIRGTLESDGVECLPVHGLRHYDSKEPMPPADEMPFVAEHIWYARAFGTELLAAVDRLRPDLLLVDVMLNYALVAAQCSGLPTAVLCHFPYHLLLGQFAPLFASRLDETNAYATELGLAPFASHQALVEASPLVLVPTYRAFDQVETVAPNVVHVGPCRSNHAGAAAWQRQAPERPLVLVGLSTSYQNQVPLLQRLCDALGTLEVEALVTTGAAIGPELLDASDNTTVLSCLSHDAVLPSTDLLLTHAGHGTVMAGATYGVPMLCFPMGRDQPMIAERVAQLGLGSVLSHEAPVSELKQAITETLADGGTRQRAEEFARSLVGHPGLDDATRLVEALMGNGR
jgi:UDP:flavonoid glycosyltransferase YjiC (YdhE family)